MTIARRRQISLEQTPYYHCTSRCVRRAFLCGSDRYSGKNFEHRRHWLEQRLKMLADIFAIDLLAYAIMSNHYHVVVRIDPDRARRWSEAELIERWQKLYPKALHHGDPVVLSQWRSRLADISWYMRSINEPMARRANREDGCTGRFWEGRFRSQALLDETALLKCMTYVDLNPIRANEAETPETSAHTSIKARIGGDDRHLLGFNCDKTGPGIPISRVAYFEFVDWTGRLLRTDKRGAIPSHLPTILVRLAERPDAWRREIRCYGSWYYRAVGALEALKRYCEHLGQRRLKGMGKTAAALN